jgi:F-type H+-transporting ATPase subunit epsilon
MTLPRALTLQIVTPDRSVVHEEVEEVEVPGVEGYFGVLPGHTPLLALLEAGDLWYRRGQERHHLAIAFGFAEVLPDRVTILAEVAERPDEIDVARARAALDRARDQLARPSVDVDVARARAAFRKATVRVQVAERWSRA